MLHLFNLKTSQIINRSEIVQKTTALFSKMPPDAYQLSMPLMISAELGEEKLYQEILKKMQLEITHSKSLPSNTFKG